MREVSLENPIRRPLRDYTDVHSSRKEKKRALARSFAKLTQLYKTEPISKMGELSNV